MWRFSVEIINPIVEKTVGPVLLHSWASQQLSPSKSEAAIDAARLLLKTSVKGKLLQLVSSVLPTKTNGFLSLCQLPSADANSVLLEKENGMRLHCIGNQKSRSAVPFVRTARGPSLVGVCNPPPEKKYNCVIAYESSTVLFTDTQSAPLEPSVWSWTATLSWGAINPSFCLQCCTNRCGCLKSTFFPY